jgi:type I restriction enzyme S subunit
VHLGYLRLYFLSSCFLDGIASSIHGGVNQNIHAEDIKNQLAPLPPRAEQEGIAIRTIFELEKYGEIVMAAQDQILLLQERRSALISAAVTGQIDVRGLVPEAVAA